MLDAQLDIAKKNVQLNDSTTNIIKLKFDAGQVTSLGIQQSEAQRLSAAQLIPLLEQNIAIQENALSVLTGSFPNRSCSGFSSICFTRTRKPTDSRPSITL